jgi:CBS domain-containing protein
MRVGDVMTRRVETVPETETAEAALARMKSRRIRHLVAMRDGHISGVVSSRDLTALGSFRQLQSVGDVMTSPAVTAASDATLRQAANMLRGRSIGCLPVVDDGRLVGILTTTDLLELIGRGVERPMTKGRRWVMKGRGPRRKSVVGRRFEGRQIQ